VDVAVEGHFYSFFSQNKKKLKKNEKMLVFLNKKA
jgi:hypothetical protein